MAATPEQEISIDVQNLVKRYPKSNVNAVDGISFRVRRGEIFGLLGPNGAGKTTTIGILTTNVLPTSGTAGIMGINVVDDPMSVKQRIGEAGADWSDVLADLHAPDLYRLHLLPLGLARLDQVVPDHHALQPLDLRCRGTAFCHGTHLQWSHASHACAGVGNPGIGCYHRGVLHPGNQDFPQPCGELMQL